MSNAFEQMKRQMDMLSKQMEHLMPGSMNLEEFGDIGGGRRRQRKQRGGGQTGLLDWVQPFASDSGDVGGSGSGASGHGGTDLIELGGGGSTGIVSPFAAGGLRALKPLVTKVDFIDIGNEFLFKAEMPSVDRKDIHIKVCRKRSEV